MFPSSLLIAAGLPLFALPTWAVAAPGVVNPLSHVKRAEAHEVAELFKRQQTNYPNRNEVPPESSIPKAWLDKLASINIPSDVPVSTGTPLPAYGSRSKSDPAICSFTYECINPEDLYAPPAGRLAFTFDDGVAGGSDALLSYMQQNGAMGKATHFMIGSYISLDQDKFKQIASGGGHIGVHTWSHQYTTTLTNVQVLGELGWTMQIMSDLNGGRIPRYWRPPFGDVDNRVRAIAKGVFGLETVIWNHDTGDWNLDQPGSTYTLQSINDEYTKWLGDKSQGLNVLEHEVRPGQIEVFKVIYPRAQQMGWQVGNVADMWGKPWYQNAATGNGTVTPMSVGGAAVMGSASATGSSASASASSSASTSSSSASASAASSSQSASSSSPSSASASPTNQNAAVSPSTTRASGAVSQFGEAAWTLIIPALGILAALI